MSEAFTKIKTSHKFTGDVSGLQTYYGRWAQNYNRDLADQKWVCPEVTCDIVKAVATSYFRGEITILDAGCGTGLVGIGLKQRGFAIIDGIDLTNEMANLARQTGAYRHLNGGIDLNLPPSALPELPYDIVVSSGMFTHGHVEPAALLSLVDYCRKGGFVIVSTRASYAETTQFETFLNDKVLSLDVQLVFCVRDARHIKEESGHYWVLRRNSP
jgi:predicted TPR repeat methyltransferase